MKKLTLLLLSIILMLCSAQISAQTTWNSTDYSDPNQPTPTILPPFFKMRRVGTSHPGIVGTIMRVLHYENYSLVLSHSEAGTFQTKCVDRSKIKITGSHTIVDNTSESNKNPRDPANWIDTEIVTYYTPHLYIVEHTVDANNVPTGETVLFEIALKANDGTVSSGSEDKIGLRSRWVNNLGDYCNLSDIALSADGYIIGCNYVRGYEQYNLPKQYENSSSDNAIGNEYAWGEDYAYNQYLQANDQDLTNKKRYYERSKFFIYKWTTKFADIITEVKKYNGTPPTGGLQADIYQPTKWIQLDYTPKTGTGLANSTVFNLITGNYPRSETGYSFAVSGNADSKDSNNPFWFTFTAERVPNYENTEKNYNNSTKPYGNSKMREIVLRLVHLPIVNGQIQTEKASVSVRKNQITENNISSVDEFKVKTEVGKWYELNSSPFQQKSWVIDGPLCTPHEFVQNDVDLSKNNIERWQNEWTASSAMPENQVGKFPVSPCFFRYGRKNVMLYPKQEGNYITGFDLWEVSFVQDKMKKPTKVQLITSMDVKSGFKSIDLSGKSGEDTYYKAVANVEGADITIYFFRDLTSGTNPNGTPNLTRTVETYTTKGVEQGRGIYAYGLSSSFDSHINEYTFNFKLNEYPYKAVLKLYKESANGGGAAVKDLIASHILINNGTPQNYVSKILKPGDLYEVKIAGNKLTVEDGERKAEPGTKLTWAIEVTDTTVYNWQHVENHWFQGEASFAAVDNSSESPYMGNVYRWDDGGSDNTAGVRQYTFIKNSGASIDPQEHENTTATTPSNLSSSGRFAVDEAGNLYMPGSDGVYVIEPNALGTATKWENKTIKNIKTVATYGKGKDEVLIIVQCPSGNALITTYGKNDNGTWNSSALSTITIDKNKYLTGGSDLNIVPTAYGYFVINHCWQVENSIANRTLMFFRKDDGTKKTSKESFRNFTNEPEYASITDDRKYNNNKQIDAIYGSHGAGAAITSDEGVFILHSWRPKKKDENGNYVYDYKGKFSVYEMNWGRLPRKNQGQTDASVYNNSNLFLQDSEQFYFYTNDHDWNYIRQMHFDYGGNLVIAGDMSSLIYVAEYAVPKLKTTQMGRVYDDASANGDYTVPYYSRNFPNPVTEASIIPDETFKMVLKRPSADKPGDDNFRTLTFLQNDIINRTETPARSLPAYTAEQCDDYDRVFDNDGGKGDGKWNTPANWIPSQIQEGEQIQPHPDHRVRIDAAVTVDVTTATAGYIDISPEALKDVDGKDIPALTIAPTGGLTVGGNGINTPYNDAKDAQNNAVEGLISYVPTYNQAKEDNPSNIALNPTLRTDRNKTATNGAEELLTAADIVIQASGTPNAGNATQGSLALHNLKRLPLIGETAETDGLITLKASAPTQATVEIYGQYTYPSKEALTENPQSSTNPLTWQYIGTPFAADDAASTAFRGSWMYRWSEQDAMWYILAGWGHPIYPWQGYLLTQEYHSTYSFTGTLQPSTSVTIDGRNNKKEQELELMTYTTTRPEGHATSYRGANFLANSWTAPLQIAKFTTYSAFTNCDATIYLYAPKARQYVAVPIGQTAAIGITQINPLQGFFVLANNTSASVTLDYARLVATDKQDYIPDSKLDTWAKDNSQPAPKRLVQDSEPTENEQEMMRIHVQGNDGSTDDIILFQNEDYTLGFDNGYDGRKMLGGEGTPYFTACAADGDMAVLATPAFYGTTLNFRRGTAKEYTLSFDYDAPDSDLVLQDLLTKTYVEIRTGNTYTFTAADDNLSKRFRITRRSTEMVEYEPDAYVVQGKLYVDNPTDEVIGVALFSVDGKLISHFGTRDALCELEVPCEGVYIVHLTTSNGTTTVKQIL